MTPLARIIVERIRAKGPMPVAEYMALVAGHHVHGYYPTRDPLGADGDFITAPEISQMFGELIGLWCADLWHRSAWRETVRLVELGPGRGTLMADVLRAAARVATGFRAAVEVHLVETSPVLRDAQRATLGENKAIWHDSIDSLPRGPLLVVANEFFDALPIQQLERTDGGWTERRVGLASDGETLCFMRGEDFEGCLPPTAAPAAPIGAIAESCPQAQALAAWIGRRIAGDGGAALWIDYGYTESEPGDTLQAVRRHRHVSVLDSPGTADLTAHVDFAALGAVARAAGVLVHGPVMQGAFLTTLGIHARAARIKDGATPDQAAAVDRALARLTDPEQMGALFKVMALTAPGAAVPAGFAGAGA